MSAPVELRCIRCERVASAPRLGDGCGHCSSDGAPSNLTTVYDLDRAAGELRRTLQRESGGTDRYAAVLPVEADDLGANPAPTPLIDAPRLASHIGVARLWIKDESRGPTWSFKDRAAVIAAAHARRCGAGVVVTASTGNAAAATVAHARRAGLVAVVLFAANVDPLMAAFVRSYGGVVAVVTSKEDRWRLMRDGVAEFGWYPNSNMQDPPIGNNAFAVDGYKPLAYEMWEQLGRRSPRRVYLPICYGDALYGSWKGWTELAAMGLTSHVPVHSGGEVYGTLTSALADGADAISKADLDRGTLAFSMSAAQSTYQALHALRRSGGDVSPIADDAILAAQRLIVEAEGLLVETASASAVAALVAHRRQGRVGDDEEIVVVNSSSGLKSLGVAAPGDEPPLIGSLDDLAALLPEQPTTGPQTAPPTTAIRARSALS